MRGREENKEEPQVDIHILPDEMVVQVLQQLPLASLATTQAVSSRLHALSNEQIIWKRKFLELEKIILKGKFKAAYEFFWQKKIAVIAATSYKKAYQQLLLFVKKSEVSLQILMKERRFNSPNVQYDRCLAAYKLANFKTAFLLINKLIKQRREMIFMYPHCRTNMSQLTDVYYWRGCILEKLTQYDAAITDFSIYLRGEGQNPRAHLHLANCYSSQKKFDLAIQRYKIHLDSYFKNNASASLNDAPVVRVLDALSAAEHAIKTTIILPETLPKQSSKPRWSFSFFSKAPVAKLKTVEKTLPGMHL